MGLLDGPLFGDLLVLLAQKLFTFYGHTPAHRPLTSIHLPADTCRGQCQHTCKRSCRICHILAPLTPPETKALHKPTQPANLKDWICFVNTVACTLSAPATFCPWVPTLSWRMTAGRSQLTSSTKTARSCCSSLGWLSMTENFRVLKSQSNTQLSSSSRTRKDRGQVVIWARPQMGGCFSSRSPGLCLRCEENWRSLWGFCRKAEAHHCCAAELDPEYGMNW